MKSLLVLLAVALFSVDVTACVGAGKGTRSASHTSSKAAAAGSAAARTAAAAAPTRGHFEGDDDGDDNPSHKDDDDRRIRGYGREARATDRRAVTALVRRYYATAAAGDGAAACSLVYASLAKSSSFVKAVPLAYAPAPGSSVFRGKSCAQVASLLFELVDRRQLAADVATLQVTSLRVDGHHGLALLGFRTTPERWIPVQREGAVWKIDSLLDSELP